MNPAEVVVSEIDGQHRLEIFPFLTESISQSRESADRGSHAEIRPLNNACADAARIGIADHNLGRGLYYFGRRVSVFTIGIGAIDLD